MLHAFPESHTEIDTKTVWVDLLHPTPAELERVTQRFGLRIPLRSELEEIESSSRLRVEHGVVYLSLPVVVYGDGGDPVPAPIGFVLSPSVLITIRFSEPHAFKAVRSRCEKRGGQFGSEETFAAIIEEMVDFGADLLEKISAELAGVSKCVFRPEVGRPRRIAQSARMLRSMLRDVGNSGEHLSYIRETILGLQRIIGFTSDAAEDWLKPATQSRLKTQRHDLTSLAEFESHLSGKVQFLLDATLGFINTEQNDIFKVLTIVSVVGIPPTLIASMYGMNFHNMPEYSWSFGYEWGLGLIVLSTLVPMAWFKWRGWW